MYSQSAKSPTKIQLSRLDSFHSPMLSELLPPMYQQSPHHHQCENLEWMAAEELQFQNVHLSICPPAHKQCLDLLQTVVDVDNRLTRFKYRPQNLSTPPMMEAAEAVIAAWPLGIYV